VNGVYQVSVDGKPTFVCPTVDEFYQDMAFMNKVTQPGPVTTYSYKRIQVLEEKFNLHEMLNSDREQAIQKTVPHRDFYNVVCKGCNHPIIVLSSCFLLISVHNTDPFSVHLYAFFFREKWIRTFTIVHA
jgi:hypothetical protein